MTIQQARKLKEGDKVVWPEGANECKESHGVVLRNQNSALYVKWEDGEITFLHDLGAFRFVEVENTPRRNLALEIASGLNNQTRETK